MMVCDTAFLIRPPRRQDGRALLGLVRASGALDVNSSYLYYLLADHFANTCALAFRGDQAAGFVSAYRLPGDPASLFVWQVAVSPAFRGCGLGLTLLEHLTQRAWFSEIRNVCCTIGASNKASRRLFDKWADRLGGAWRESPYLTASELGAGHEAEPLLTMDLAGVCPGHVRPNGKDV